MLEPWNDKSILPPPVHTFICNTKIDLKLIKHILNNIINVLTKQSPLHNESAICSRLLYKFDKKFRNDIGYRSFKKVNCALRRYLLINLLKDVEQFASALPDEEDTPCYLPTKQMLQYILVRVIAFSKLMIRIIVCSKQAAVFYLDRVKRGEKHWMSLMPYAVLSRVWSMTFVLLQHSCSWYQQLYPFLDELQLKGLHFLPSHYTLPVNLSDWLQIKDINTFGRLEWAKKKTIDIDPSLMNDDVDNFENILNYVNEVNENLVEIQDSNQDISKNNLPDMALIKQVDHGEVISRKSFELMNKKQIMMNTSDMVPIKQVDHGEVISRKSFELMNKKQIMMNTTKKDEYFHVTDQITNKKALQLFIDNEETFRNEGSNRSLTNHLSFMQWQSLKQSLLKLDSLILDNRKLQRRFQKIWQEKCLKA